MVAGAQQGTSCVKTDNASWTCASRARYVVSRGAIVAVLILSSLCWLAATPLSFVEEDLQAKDGALPSQQLSAVQQLQGQEGPGIQVCICAEDTRSLDKAVRSAVAAASQPARLSLHALVPPGAVQAAQAWLKRARLDVEVHASADVHRRIQANLGGGAAKGNAGGMCNMAIFYLPELLGEAWANTQRLVYLSSGLLVLGDVVELSDSSDLQGFPGAAVPNCKQSAASYIDFESLNELGFAGTYDPTECTWHVGVMLIDPLRWMQADISAQAEAWFARHRSLQSRKHNLWKQTDAVAESALVLASKHELAELRAAWYCECSTAANRPMLPEEATEVILEMGLDRDALAQLDVTVDAQGSMSPGLVPCTSSAKLLRFVGGPGPWTAAAGPGSSNPAPGPLCAVPAAQAHRDWSWSRTARGQRFARCSEVWHRAGTAAGHGPLATATVPAQRKSADREPQRQQQQQQQQQRRQQPKLHSLRRPQLGGTQKWQRQEPASKNSAPVLAGNYDQSLATQSVEQFPPGSHVTATRDVFLGGKSVVVPKGSQGLVVGPSVLYPTQRLAVTFTSKKGKVTMLNLLPAELLDMGDVVLVPGEYKFKELFIR